MSPIELSWRAFYLFVLIREARFMKTNCRQSDPMDIIVGQNPIEGGI